MAGNLAVECIVFSELSYYQNLEHSIIQAFEFYKVVVAEFGAIQSSLSWLAEIGHSKTIR